MMDEARKYASRAGVAEARVDALGATALATADMLKEHVEALLEMAEKVEEPLRHRLRHRAEMIRNRADHLGHEARWALREQVAAEEAA